MTEQEALLSLNAIPGLGNRRIRALLDYYGCAKVIWQLKRQDLERVKGLPQQVVDNIFNFPQDKFLKSEYNHLHSHQARVITCADDAYPTLLAQIPDAPIVLYVQGVLASQPNVAVGMVGSRRASMYGLSMAKMFARRLSEQGLVVVSGMARGIDTAAHQGALESGGVTWAVCGCGLAVVYPPENKALKKAIAQQGAVISEFPMATEPRPYHFPRRNRIISGMSQGIIVVEAAQKSGALITADFALEQGRDVYAIPGRVDVASASGTNNLIKQGARLVTEVEEVLDDLCPQWAAKAQESVESKFDVAPQRHDVSDEDQIILSQLTQQPVHIDRIVKLSCRPITQVAGTLLRLELKGLVQQIPGQWFCLKSFRTSEACLA